MAVDPSVTFVDAARPANGGTSGGAAGAIQFRLADHTFTAGGATIAGADRPNPRAISNVVFSQTDASGAPVDKPSEGGFSNLLWVWGQFLDHDLDQTGNGAAFGTAPITVPTGDPVFAPGSTLSFNRSQFVTGTGTSAANPRQYDNDVTSLIDGSNIYGSSAEKLAAIRVAGSAKLKVTADGTIGFASGDPVFGNGAVTGDTRANENVGLLSMHALFAREHNRLVDELAAADPTLTVSELFEGARARVEAIMQAITYQEFLPILIGDNALAEFSGFKANVNPAISLEFSTAVYRFGHSLLSASIDRINENGTTHALGNLALRDAFNTRGVVEQTGIEAIFRGLADSMSQQFDTFFVEDVRSLLFGQGGPGTDLAALNIQRGRDHGLPTYNQLRVALGLDPKTSFAQVTSDSDMAARLSQAYGGDISKLDLYVGGLAEDPVAGGIMGETYRAVLIDQFTRLRDGDRFWSEGRGFSAAELEELWDTQLSDVIRRNSDVADLQDDAFLAFNRVAGNDGNNTLTGGNVRSLLIGNGGNDTLIGGLLDDHLVGGAGADRLEGRAGANVLIGGAGGDTFAIHVDRTNATTIRDFSAGDVIEFLNSTGVPAMTITDGPKGAIIRFGGATILVEGVLAADLPFGGGPTPGVTLNGDGKGNVLTGGAGDDTINGNGGNDTLSGLGGRDVLVGGSGADSLSGGDGDDQLTGGSGRDAVNGGAGNDVFFIRGATAQDDTMTGGDGIDTIRLDDTSADIVLFGTSRITGIENWEGGGRAVLGSATADLLDFSIFSSVTGVASIQGLGGDDTLIGAAGADVLFGGDGADRLEGRAGVNSLTGGAGIDTFVIHVDRTNQTTVRDFTAQDLVEFANSAGVPAMTVVDGPNGATVTFGGATVLFEGVAAADLPFAPPPPAGLTLTGNSGNNTLTGAGGDDTISGLAGNDTLSGLGGADTILGGSGTDTIDGGTGADTLDGGVGVDQVTGGDGADIFLIRATEAQTDVMAGGAGVDRIRVATAADVTLLGTTRITGMEIFEGGGGSVRGSAGADVFDFAPFTSVTGVAAIRGLDGDDTITGSVGADVIRGDVGNDILNGAGGDDTLSGNAGSDTFFCVAGLTSGRDTITDFDAAGNDFIRFSGYNFGSADPGSLSTAAKLAAVVEATVFSGGGATIDLAELGGAGELRLDNVTAARLSFTAEDFLFS